MSPPACSTPVNRSAPRSGWHCSVPSPGRPSRKASALSSRMRQRPPRRRASRCRSRAYPHLRPSTITPWRSASPWVPCFRGDRAAGPARRDRHHSGPPPGTDRCRAPAARGGAGARDCATARGPSRPRRGSPSLPVVLADTHPTFSGPAGVDNRAERIPEDQRAPHTLARRNQNLSDAWTGKRPPSANPAGYDGFGGVTAPIARLPLWSPLILGTGWGRGNRPATTPYRGRPLPRSRPA